MRNISLARRLAQIDPSHLEHEPPLTAAERRNVALAALQIREQHYRLRLSQIAAERRSLLASAFEARGYG